MHDSCCGERSCGGRGERSSDTSQWPSPLALRLCCRRRASRLRFAALLPAVVVFRCLSSSSLSRPLRRFSLPKLTLPPHPSRRDVDSGHTGEIVWRRDAGASEHTGDAVAATAAALVDPHHAKHPRPDTHAHTAGIAQPDGTLRRTRRRQPPTFTAGITGHSKCSAKQQHAHEPTWNHCSCRRRSSRRPALRLAIPHTRQASGQVSARQNAGPGNVRKVRNSTHTQVE